MIQQHVGSFSKLSSFKISYLGCRVNQYEAQVYRDQLEILGLKEEKEDLKPADLCIINTCAVTLSAESSSRNQIRKILKSNPKARVIITGCLTSLKEGLLKEFQNRCEFVSNKDKEDLIAKIFPYEKIFPEFCIKNFSNRSRAFVKIQDGCNSFCTYCIIPYLRGRSRSRTFSSILSEVHGIVEKGFKEIVITGINVGDFNSEGKRLDNLIRELDEIQGLERIRISSIDPDDVTNDLFAALISSKKVCHSLHLVLQSGSNSILKRMNRKYNRSNFFNCINRFRAVDPNFSISTDIIVGFPGESDQDFEDTLNVVKEVKFSKVHVFPYSPRSRTRAMLYENQLPSSIINMRKKVLFEIAKKEAFIWRERFLGKKEVVLIEQIQDGFALGHSDSFLLIKFPNKCFKIGELVEVEVISNLENSLLGRSL